MKKLTWATHKSLFGQIATSTCLLGGSAALVFGISAGTFSVRYFDLTDAQVRLNAAKTHNCYNQKVNSQWNMYQKGTVGKAGYVKGWTQPYEQSILVDPTVAKPSLSEPNEWWKQLHAGATALFKQTPGSSINPADMSIEKTRGTPLESNEEAMRKKYSSLVIDGATHTALDRSFNQSLNDGMASFTKNTSVKVNTEGETQVYKPAQDNTQEFINVYREAAKNSKVVCLAGFNHVTPLMAIGKLDAASGRWNYGDDVNINNCGLMLIDGDIANNQNIASVLFRSDQPAFLSALATAMYFFNNLDVYHEGFKDISVATYGGNPLPSVVVYMGGFQRGVEFFNQMILKDVWLHDHLDGYLKNGTTTYTYLNKMIEASKYKAEIEAEKGKGLAKYDDFYQKLYDEYSIKMIKLGDFSTHFTGSFAAGDAIGISKQFLNRGASAIIAVAGPQSLDTAQEILNQKSSCIVIGVDSAMEDSDYQKPLGKSQFKDKTVAADNSKSAQTNNIIKFSAVKDMTSVTEKIIRLAAEGKNWDTTNAEPWTTPSTIPAWAEGDEVSQSDIQFEKIGTDTCQVTGFKNIPSGKTVLRIPTTWEAEDGTTCKLVKITNTGTNKFNASTLKGITTLKIDGELSRDLTFDDKAFDFSQPKVDPESGFKYIDLTTLDSQYIKSASDGAHPFFKIEGDADTRSNVYHKGVIKFNEFYKSVPFKTPFEKLFPPTTSGNGQNVHPWAIVEADPYKSVGSFGFKTCGNIENGLISISWDGWVYLLEALSQLTYIRKWETNGSDISFIQMWNWAAQQWWTNTQQTGGGTDEFRAIAQYGAFTLDYDESWKEAEKAKCLSTFNRNSEIYKNYPYVMSILGIMFNESNLKFNKDMTVYLDNEGTPHLPDQDISMTILEWLEENMYFIS